MSKIIKYGLIVKTQTLQDTRKSINKLETKGIDLLYTLYTVLKSGVF